MDQILRGKEVFERWYSALDTADNIVSAYLCNAVISFHGVGFLVAYVHRIAMNSKKGDATPPQAAQPGTGGVFATSQVSTVDEEYVHRNVGCDQCGMNPIVGSRFKCGNCVNFDLCSNCESRRMHPLTHTFIKIDVPLPLFSRSAEPMLRHPLYHGTNDIDPSMFHQPHIQALTALGFSTEQLFALYRQFSLMSSSAAGIDPAGFTAQLVAISRDNELISRFFHFFDVDGDGLISFEEFVTGYAAVYRIGPRQNELRADRAVCMCDVYGDGLITPETIERLSSAYIRLCEESGSWMGCRVADQILDRFDEKLARPVSAVFPESMGENTTPRGALPGMLNPPELTRMLAAHHASAAHALGQSMLVFDATGSGSLTKAEFLEWMASVDVVDTWITALRRSI